MQTEYNNIEISDKLDDVVTGGLEKVQKVRRRQIMKKVVIGTGSTVAVFAASFILMASNPAMAAKIPVIGNIFSKMANGYSYGDGFDEFVVPLESEEIAEQIEAAQQEGRAKEADELSAYTKTIDGTTVTLSETYCNDQALYLSLMLTSENGFEDTLINQDDKPNLFIETVAKFSYNNNELSGNYYLEGDFLDENTYVGLVRIDLNETNTEWDEEAYDAYCKSLEEAGVDFGNMSEEQEKEFASFYNDIDIPEKFTLELNINRIIGDKAEPVGYEFDKTEEELIAMSDEEWSEYMNSQDMSGWDTYPNENENYWFDGVWEFDLDIEKDDSRTQTVVFNEDLGNGLFLESVQKTPFEIFVYETDENMAYFPVIVDANGDMMQSGGNGGIVNSVAIQDRDVSTVYIYFCDYDEYMDELKGYYYMDGYEERRKDKTFKEYLDEKAVYSKEITFGNE